jgi:hypothetical protein
MSVAVAVAAVGERKEEIDTEITSGDGERIGTNTGDDSALDDGPLLLLLLPFVPIGIAVIAVVAVKGTDDDDDDDVVVTNVAGTNDDMSSDDGKVVAVYAANVVLLGGVSMMPLDDDERGARIGVGVGIIMGDERPDCNGVTDGEEWGETDGDEWDIIGDGGVGMDDEDDTVVGTGERLFDEDDTVAVVGGEEKVVAVGLRPGESSEMAAAPPDMDDDDIVVVDDTEGSVNDTRDGGAYDQCGIRVVNIWSQIGNRSSAPATGIGHSAICVAAASIAPTPDS